VCAHTYTHTHTHTHTGGGGGHGGGGPPTAAVAATAAAAGAAAAAAGGNADVAVAAALAAADAAAVETSGAEVFGSVADANLYAGLQGFKTLTSLVLQECSGQLVSVVKGHFITFFISIDIRDIQDVCVLSLVPKNSPYFRRKNP